MAPKMIFVIDPINRTGKIAIPMELTEETRGLSEFLKSNDKVQRDLSLCLLFQKGRCNAGNRCHQIHANRDLVTSLREKSSSTSTCCAAHGDVHSTSLLSENRKVQLVAADGSVSIHTLANFGATQALETIIRNSNHGTIRLTANKICRLHGQSRCKFGRDCKNVHFCRDATMISSSNTSSCNVSVNNTVSAESSANTTPVKGSPVVRPADIVEVQEQAASIRTKRVLPPQPADFFRLDDMIPSSAAPTPCKAIQTPTIYTPTTVGYSPMSSSFQIFTPSASSTTSTSSKNSAILRPLRAVDLHEAQQQQITLSTMFDNVLMQHPLSRSKIGISPSIATCQSDLDISRLCDDILGSLSPSWITA